jgi:hypothetical protein
MIKGEIIEVPVDPRIAESIVKERLDGLPNYRYGELVIAETGERYAMVAVSVTELVDLVVDGMISALVRQKLGITE